MNVLVQTPTLAPGFAADGIAPARAARDRVSAFAAQVDPAIALSILIVIAVLACALAPGAIAPFGATDLDRDALLQAPGAAHLLGTDHLGRDILSLIIHGARQSVEVAIGAVLLGTIAGGLVGLVAGYLEGAVDMALMRLLDVWLSIPPLLMVIIIATALSPSLFHIILAIGIVTVPGRARIMRSAVIAIRRQPYIAACRAMGASPARILLRHIVPHTLSQTLVLATLGIATAILMGAMLSFLGIGVIDDTPDWGFLLNQGSSYLTVAWWFGTFPGLAITALVIAVNVLGEALRYRLDPHARSR